MNMKKLTAASVLAMSTAMPAAVIGDPIAEQPIDQAIKALTDQVERVGGETKETAENALKEAKAAGAVSAETAAKADELLSNQSETSKALKALTEAVEALDGKTADISQLVADGANNTPGGAMTLGAAVVEQEEKLKAFVANGASGTLSLNVGNAITTADGSGGGLIFHEEERTPVRLPRRQLRMRQLLTVGSTGTNLVPYRKQLLRTNNAGMVAEQGTYTASEYGWGKAEAAVRKIGHVTNISEETLADASLLQTELDGEMRYGLDLEEDRQILSGDGVGENLSGLIPAAPDFVAPAGLPNETRIDRLRLAMLRIVLEDYVATAMVLNPLDWAAIDLLKNANGNYIFGNPNSQSTPTLWGKDVVESNTMSGNEWIIGDFAMAATLYDRQDTEVLISSEHGDNFIEDMLTMKARKRLAMAVKRALAMIKGDFVFA